MDSECSEDDFGPKRGSLYLVIPLTIVYIFIFITGTVGNFSTCIVIAKNKFMHTATNYFLFSLAISDQLLLVFGLPLEVYSFWSRYPYIFGSTVCLLRGLLSEISGNASILLITAFTIERYLAICHPFLSRTLSDLSRTIKLIILIWILSICLAIPQAYSLNVVLIGTCPQCFAADSKIEHIFEISTLLLFVIPMTIITVLYVLIAVNLKFSRTIKKTNTHASIQRKSSWKVVKMLIAVVAAFFICWAPFHLQRVISIYQDQKLTEENRAFHLKIYEVVTSVSGILYYTSATINPILYNIMSAKFREAFKETFSCLRFQETHHKSQRSSSSFGSNYNMKFLDTINSRNQDDSTQSFSFSIRKNSSELVNDCFLKKLPLERESTEAKPIKESADETNLC